MRDLVALLLVAAQIQSVHPVIHTLKYIHTGSSQIPNFPEYMSVGYVDGLQITHYDSKSGKYRPKQDWMNKITAEEPRYWETQTQISIGAQQLYEVDIETAKERFNQTGGVHMFQRMYACEWDDETGEVDGWEHYAYDGEDFISFDLKGLRWIAVKPQAVVTKHKWDQDDSYNQYLNYYYTEECPSYLKKYVSFGRDFLMRTELPRISLLQKTSRSPVTCHATGFYPREAALFWKKDGEELFEDVEMGETLPNHDGTFQTTADLKAVDPDAKYECVFQLAGVPEDVVIPLDPANVLSNERIRAEEQRKTAVAVAVPLALLALVVAIVVLVVKCRKAKYAPASVQADSESTSSERASETTYPTAETPLAEPAPE
ncbi:major histocompatibility complex class I-related gene protein-like isoform X2 [Corythoichthys intestinalis]|uniref:major histocompatibility complex class I-related gene protein-like isoform X2 n=1 Tax=Corythoichthys intestinalis TaxID=161448 RepID=UPI0025A6490D|nr:major histocompatibility complex class I-related gene protein-like isoform X2 [Corythoichthys intestinalis]